MGRDIFRGERGTFGHFRRRSSSGHVADAQTLRRRAGDFVRQNVGRNVVAGCIDDVRPADILRAVRCPRRKNFSACRDGRARNCRACGGGHVDCGVDDFCQSQRRLVRDIPVKAGDKAVYQEAGKAAVDALKITSEIGQVDIFANVSISNLFNMLSEKAISRDGEEAEEEIDLFGPLFESSVSEVTACITEDGKFTEQRYNKFVMECKALRASYEMLAKGYDIDVEAPLKGQAAVDSGLVIEDLGHYIISVVFSAVDTYADKAVDFLTAFINGDEESAGYYEMLINADLDNLPDFDEVDMDDDFSESIIENMGGNLGDEDFSEVLKEIIRDENTTVGGRISNVLKTIGVILIDSEYEALLSQIEVSGEDAPEKGSLKCFLYAF